MSQIMQVIDVRSPIFYLMLAWAVVWKGIALWHAARGGQKAWYVAILFVNSIGILEIIYLQFFRKK
jgi:methionyl-tRNA synthetase